MSSENSLWPTIIFMGAVTYSLRAAPFVRLSVKSKACPALTRFLDVVTVTMIGGLISTDVFAPLFTTTTEPAALGSFIMRVLLVAFAFYLAHKFGPEKGFVFGLLTVALTAIGGLL